MSRKGAKAMRVLAALLISALMLMWAPQMSLAEEAAGGIESPATHEHSIAPVDDGSSSITLQEIAIGTAVLSGAFAVGAVAGGTVATGLAAAGAVVLIYNFLP
jgi:hypothetical protein